MTLRTPMRSLWNPKYIQMFYDAQNEIYKRKHGNI